MADPRVVGTEMLTAEEALKRMLAAVAPLAGSEHVPLTEALGRVLAKDVFARVTAPPTDNAAMDGYAVRAADAVPGVPLPVSATVPAGRAPEPLQAGTAARIFTGAPIPAGADTVVPQEACERRGEHVLMTSAPRPGRHIRPAGEDVRAGDQMLQAGMRLRPQDLAQAATGGHASLAVRPRLRVAVLATGDELVEPGRSLQPGQIYNSNSFALLGLLQGLGCEVSICSRVADTLEATVAALEEAAANSHLIISSGGVSVGDEDHVKAAVNRLGSVDLWRVAIKPGKPVAMGRIAGTPFLGLPGNPVSLFVTFCLFGRSVVLRRQGASDPYPQVLPGHAAFALEPESRTRFLRARVNTLAGSLSVELFPHQGSGVMSSTIWANSLVEIPAGQAVVAGDAVRVLPFSELLH